MKIKDSKWVCLGCLGRLCFVDYDKCPQRCHVNANYDCYWEKCDINISVSDSDREKISPDYR